MHITLRFVGEVDARQADDVALALEDVRVEPLQLQIQGVGQFESGSKRGRSVWARIVTTPALLDLQRRVERACQRAGLAPEGRKYLPHITLARLNAASGPAAHWLLRYQGLSLGPWVAEGFALYRSHMLDHGARYEKMALYQ